MNIIPLGSHQTFIQEIRQYAAIQELDEAMLHRLISRIVVGEVKKVGGLIIFV